MTDRREERDAQDRRKACRAAIGSKALAAAVLYVPPYEERREDKRKADHPDPPDTD